MTSFLSASPPPAYLTDIMVVQTDMILQHQQMPAHKQFNPASLPGTSVPPKVLMALTLAAVSPHENSQILLPPSGICLGFVRNSRLEFFR